MPPGREDEARAFYVGVCGMTELIEAAGTGESAAAPGSPAVSCQLHLGVEAGVSRFGEGASGDSLRRSRGARSALARVRVYQVRDDDDVPGTRRAFVHDPFGNRIELIALIRLLRPRDDRADRRRRGDRAAALGRQGARRERARRRCDARSRCACAAAGWSEIEVADDGAGIAPERAAARAAAPCDLEARATRPALTRSTRSGFAAKGWPRSRRSRS